MAACDGSALALPAKTPVDNTAAVRAPARIKPARPTLVLEAIDIDAMSKLRLVHEAKWVYRPAGAVMGITFSEHFSVIEA